MSVTIGSTIVLLHGNNSPIHDGHKALFEYAKTFGNQVVAVVVRNVMEWYYFLKTGTAHPITQTITDKLVASINAIGVPIVFFDPDFTITEDKRKETMTKMAEIMQTYRDQIILKRLGEVCQLMLADIVLRQPLGEVCRVKGPDVEAFVLKDVMDKGILGIKTPIYILPKMIRDEKIGLKIKRDKADEGFMTPEQLDSLSLVGDIMVAVRELYKDGWNGPLAERLNSKYAEMQKNLWKFHEIVVYRGGIFQNYRIELTSLAFSQPNGGTTIYEDWNVFQL